MTTSDRDLIQRALRALDEAHAEIERIYRKRGPMPKPKVAFDLKGLAAAMAYGTERIRVNMDHLRAHPEAMISQTMPHEMAHCAAAYYFEARGHGPQWQGIMEALGLQPTRCYAYEGEGFATRRAKRPYLYACACTEPHALTATVHKRIKAGRSYTCRDCKHTLRFLRAEGILTLEDLGL